MPVATEKNLNETGFWTVATCEDPVPGVVSAMSSFNYILFHKSRDSTERAGSETWSLVHEYLLEFYS